MADFAMEIKTSGQSQDPVPVSATFGNIGKDYAGSVTGLSIPCHPGGLLRQIASMSQALSPATECVTQYGTQPS